MSGTDLECQVPNLDGIDPDEAFSVVPYEKVSAHGMSGTDERMPFSAFAMLGTDKGMQFSAHARAMRSPVLMPYDATKEKAFCLREYHAKSGTEMALGATRAAICSTRSRTWYCPSAPPSQTQNAFWPVQFVPTIRLRCEITPRKWRPVHYRLDLCCAVLSLIAERVCFWCTSFLRIDLRAMRLGVSAYRNQLLFAYVQSHTEACTPT
eukprot:2550813-Rhodomonas_salina.2